METDNMTLEEKCEHLMNIVVESRKRFGKMCIDYEQKTSLMENKMLNLQLETIASYRFKPKNTIPNINVEEMTNEIEMFTKEITDKRQRIDDLRQNLKNTQNVVLQLKADRIGKKLRKPITTEAMLAKVKKINS